MYLTYLQGQFVYGWLDVKLKMLCLLQKGWSKLSRSAQGSTLLDNEVRKFGNREVEE